MLNVSLAKIFLVLAWTTTLAAALPRQGRTPDDLKKVGMTDRVTEVSAWIANQIYGSFSVLNDFFHCMQDNNGKACSQKDSQTCLAQGVSQCTPLLGKIKGFSLGAVAMIALVGVFLWVLTHPVQMFEWFWIQSQLFSIQLKYIGAPLSVQYQVFLLLWLEKSRRLEMLQIAKENGTRWLPRNEQLPHVDNLAVKKKNKKSKNAMMGPAPIMKDIVLIGGGHAHAYVLKSLGMDPMPGVQVTLITRDVETPYSGMIPGHVAGFYTKEECHIDLIKLGNFAKARIIHGEACGIDPEKKIVKIKGRPDLSYDVLSINIGSAPKLGDVSHKIQDSHVTPVKPIDGFSARWDYIVSRAKVLGEKKEGIRLAVVGGGAGGVELALSMQARLRKEFSKLGADPRLVDVTLISRNDVVMPSHSKMVQGIFMKLLKDRKINLVLGKEAVDVKNKTVICNDGTEVVFDECVWCTQAGAQPWLKETGLKLDKDGFIQIQETLESVNIQDVFSVGDICTMVNHPRPKAGVFAVRGGPPLTRNIRNKILGKPLEKWIPQKDFLGIIGTGEPTQCVASRGTLGIEGAWLWELKDWIDRTWMTGYSSRLPVMEMEEDPPSPVAVAAGPEALAALAHASMRCGGCGAKVGATVLSNVMNKIRKEFSFPNNDVVIGLDAPDDCAIVKQDPQGRAQVHTVDFFRSFIKDPFLFGKIAANHALSDCHAMCAEPRTALAIAVVPFGIEAKVEETLYQMMAGACTVLAENNCVLVGGHTCEGSELALGFSINGLVQWPNGALAKSGMKNGDVLILTKPIGTGTLLAADMRSRSKGVWIAEALRNMCVSNKAGAEILKAHGATSCTDVTGFGLLGHLWEMAKASSSQVELDLNSIPLLPGALECIQNGIFSSLQPANVRLKRSIANEEEALKHHAYPLIFDPQTSGGLLATVPAAKVLQRMCLKCS
eukprot:768100-Hanusia_phi.AAC.4